MENNLTNYSKILNEIKYYIQDTKIKMYWNIGKILFENDANKEIMEKLSNDLQINTSYLYKMQNFYKTYPNEIPSNVLTLTHYSALSEIKDPEFRNILEQKAIDQNLTVAEIKKEIKNVETLHCNVSTKKNPPKHLKPNRGELYNYKIGRAYPDAELALDLGFGVFYKCSDNKFNENEIVKVNKFDGKYSLESVNINSRKIHTYKGYLIKIVDGDTIRVAIDLGFEIFREEILRLKDVYAEELKIELGLEHKKVLERILKNVKFVVLRTYQTDKYGRYVCDVFYDDKKEVAQEIADNGKFLNQELADIFN